MTVQY